MQKTKLTVRVPRELLESVKRYAAEQNTTLTGLIEASSPHPCQAVAGERSYWSQVEGRISPDGCLRPGEHRPPAMLHLYSAKNGWDHYRPHPG